MFSVLLNLLGCVLRKMWSLLMSVCVSLRRVLSDEVVPRMPLRSGAQCSAVPYVLILCLLELPVTGRCGNFQLCGGCIHLSLRFHLVLSQTFDLLLGTDTLRTALPS